MKPTIMIPTRSSKEEKDTKNISTYEATNKKEQLASMANGLTYNLKKDKNIEVVNAPNTSKIQNVLQ